MTTNKKWKFPREHFCGFTISFCTIILLLFIFEFGTRTYHKLSPPSRNTYEVWKGLPPPYRDAPFFSQDFVNEFNYQRSRWVFSENTELSLPLDYAGHYFNIADGCRVTSFQPREHTNTVYVFGGSTIYCGEVPDEHTIPSQLQLLLNEYFGNQYLVRNYSTGGATTAAQLKRLQKITLNPGDIVIFYDSFNDILHSSLPVHLSLAEKIRQQINKRMPFSQSVCLSLAKHSAFIRTFLNPLNKRYKPDHLDHELEMSQFLNSLNERYTNSILQANQYCQQHGAKFFHFLQPSLFTVKNRSNYEKELLQNCDGLCETAFQKGYLLLQDANFEFGKFIQSYDLTEILNDRRSPGEEYFFDMVHVNHKANRIIAENIFDRIQAVLNDPPRHSSGSR
jgi:lysophospholipase L1-like esterase